MAIEDDLRDLQQQVAALQTKKTRAEVEQDNARAKALEARTVLETEYGITNQASMASKIAELEAELSTALDDVRAKLEEAGA